MIGPIWDKLSPAQKKRVLKEVAAESAKKFELYRQHLNKAFDFRALRPADRLMVYQQRTAEVWDKLMEFDWELWNVQMLDWEKMEKNRINKEFSAFNPFAQVADQSIRTNPAPTDYVGG